MSFLDGIIKTVTAPVRLAWNALGVCANGIKCVCDAVTFNGKDLKRDLGEMGSNIAGVAFSGVETAGMFFGPPGWAASALVGQVESGVRG